MERLALIGVSHRRGGAGTIEAYQEAYQGGDRDRFHELGLQEYVAIATCNRWDLVIRVPDAVTLGEMRDRIAVEGYAHPYAYERDGALEQLTRVAASLDSLNPGEDQIMHQVRAAYADAQQGGSTGPLTSFAFETALRTAKRVRREVHLAPVRTSLFSLARPTLLEVVAPGDRVVILGSGEMGSLAARSVATIEGLEVTVVSRDIAHAREVADPLGQQAMALDTFIERPIDAVALVAATPARNLVGAAVLDRIPSLRLAIDLGLPRNVDGEAARARGVGVLDVDSLQRAGNERREGLSRLFAEADAIVREAVEEAVVAWTERRLGPSIQHLRAVYLETIGDDLPADAAARLASRFARLPIEGVRALARAYGSEAADTFLAGAGLLPKEPRSIGEIGS